MLLAGIDVGNSSTEVVLADDDGGRLEVCWHGRAPTRGEKGSDASLDGAARLLDDGHRSVGRISERAAVAELRPVTTALRALDLRPAAPHAPVAVLSAEAGTPAGCGVGVGEHWPLAALERTPVGTAVIVSVAADADFTEAAGRLAGAARRGWRIAGVLAGGDDAVLISNRCGLDVPIVDEVRVGELVAGERVAIEVAAELGALRLADPYALARAFDLAPGALESLQQLARALADRRAVALVRRPAAPDRPAPTVELDVAGRTRRVPAAEAVRLIRAAVPGTVARLAPPDGPALDGLADLYVGDLRAVDDGAWLRRGLARLDGTPMAALTRRMAPTARERLEARTGVPVCMEVDEAHAAAVGAATTPGAPAGAAVCDIGAGTIDLVHGSERVVAAGAGALLTLTVSLALGISPAFAEVVKRRPSLRVQAPQLVHDELGRRRFLDRPAPAAAVGRLCVTADDGELLPLSDRLAPEEWRALRLALKREIVAGSFARAFGALAEAPRAVVVAGGVAEDDEIVRMLGERLLGEVIVGRAHTGGQLGVRGAVAWGLLLALRETQEDRRA